MDKMKRFFIGGAPEIDDVSYIAVPKDFKVRVQKYSAHTISLCRVQVHNTYMYCRIVIVLSMCCIGREVT